LNKKYNKIFKSNPELLPEIEEYVLNIINTLNVSETTRNNIELVVAEAAANCILHGNKSDETKNVFIKIKIENNKLILSFKDEGSGFNPDDVPDPTKPENILKGSGRGLHIMKSLVDSIEYKFTDSGTKVIIVITI